MYQFFVAVFLCIFMDLCSYLVSTTSNGAHIHIHMFHLPGAKGLVLHGKATCV